MEVEQQSWAKNRLSLGRSRRPQTKSNLLASDSTQSAERSFLQWRLSQTLGHFRSVPTKSSTQTNRDFHFCILTKIQQRFGNPQTSNCYCRTELWVWSSFFAEPRSHLIAASFFAASSWLEVINLSFSGLGGLGGLGGSGVNLIKAAAVAGVLMPQPRNLERQSAASYSLGKQSPAGVRKSGKSCIHLPLMKYEAIWRPWFERIN